MANLELLCRGITTFRPNPAGRRPLLDEEAFRKYLQRMIASKVGLYVASAGSGQGWSLTDDERRRVYEIGVEVCKGKVSICANIPEQPTPWLTIEQAKIAIAAKVDLVNIYGPAPVHHYISNDAETLAYYEEVLSEITYPVSIAPNMMIPEPSPRLMADLANRFPQVKVIMMQQHDNADGYYLKLRDALKRDVFISVAFGEAFHAQLLGADGVTTNAASIIPKTFRLYCDLFDKRDWAGVGKVFLDIQRFENHTKQFRAWHKVALKAFKLPGGEGGVRLPYLLPDDEQVKKFVAGLPALHIPEVEELSRAAGLAAS